MSKKAFGTTSKGVEASLYEISNGGGLRVLLTDYGASVVSIFVKDRDGNERDVILGYDNVKSYEKEYSYFGATVGRYANRISDAKINIDGVEYKLEANDNENSLHSGSNGFSKRLWTVKEQKADEITFEIEDADLEQGFPGNAVVDVTFKVTGENALAIIYNAKADKTTTFNMTNHSYFNLNGHDAGTLEQQKVQIFADFYTENSNECLPTGVIAAVEGTPMDFREPHEIMERIDADFVQLKNGSGYDHNWIPNGYQKDMVRKCAEAVGEETGIRMAVYSDQPGVQFYSGNFLDSIVKGKNGAVYGRRSGFCFETQGFPNATAYGHFPSAVLRQGEWFRSQTIFAFSKD